MADLPTTGVSDENPLRSDDPRAWDRLIEAVGPASLLYFVESRLGESLRLEFAAEDVWQDCMLYAWRDRERCEWRGVRAFRRWLLSIIEHRIQSLATRAATIKRSGAAGRFPPTTPAPTSAASDPRQVDSTSAAELSIPVSTTPSRVAVYHEEVQAIHDALQSLPEELRDVVRLRLLEEREMEDVAARLGIGVSAAYHRFRKGFDRYQRRLRAVLGGDSESKRDDGSVESISKSP